MDSPVSGRSCLKGQHSSPKPYHWLPNKPSMNNFLCSCFPKPFQWCNFYFLCIPKWRLVSGFVWSGCQIYYFWIINSGSRTSKYSWELTPIFIHKVISQIKYTQHLCSMYWWPEDSNWSRQFWSQRQIENSQLWVHKISFATQNITNTITGFFCLYLTFVLHQTEYYPTFSVMMNLKCIIGDKQVLVWMHTCFYSRSKITNQAQSTPLFNFLATVRLRLGT